MTVGAHRHVVKRHARVEHGLDARGRSAHGAGAARRDVDVAARETELDRPLKDVGVARAVRRTDVLNGHAALDAVKEHVEGADDVAEVNVQNAELARDHRAHADLREKTHDFVFGREARAVVAHGDLDAEDFGDEIEVVAHAARERGRGIGVVARVHPGGDAFGLQSADLAEKIRDRAARAVGARDAYDARGAAGDEFGENEFGRAGLGAAFAAASGHVNVLVDEARRHDEALGVDRFEVGELGGEVLADRHDLVVHGEDVDDAEVFRRKDVRTLDEICHF